MCVHCNPIGQYDDLCFKWQALNITHFEPVSAPDLNN